MTDEQKRIDSGCKCKQCFGLAEYMILWSGHDFGLERAPGCHPGRTVKLHVTTTGTPTVAPACNGLMTCPCERCVGERFEAVNRGVRPETQPWMPRPSRRARSRLQPATA